MSPVWSLQGVKRTSWNLTENGVDDPKATSTSASCVTKAPFLPGINSVRFRRLLGAAVMEKAEKSHQRRAIVIGGSIASLFVGAFLRRIGWLRPVEI